MSARVWKFSDNIDTDRLAPGAYMKGPVTELARHCLEQVRPEFGTTAQPGDFVVAGRNFGMGSSREQAAEVLKILGIRAVIAPSFAGIFYRNALNLGLLAVISPDVGKISDGDQIEIDIEGGHIQNRTTGAALICEPVPQHLADLVAAGGLVPYLENKLGVSR